jgi:hypothetical protein
MQTSSYSPSKLGFLSSAVFPFTFQYYPISEATLLSGRFPGFTPKCFWQEKRVYEDAYRELVE